MIQMPAGVESLSDSRRMEYSGRRRRLLDGTWDQDLRDYIGAHIDATRQDSWGEPSKAVNLLRSVVTQLSATYDEAPQVRHPDREDLAHLSGLFDLHQRHEDMVIAMRESAVRVGWTSETHLTRSGLFTRLVSPEALVIEAADGSPGVPAVIRELRTRVHPETGKAGQYWDVWDIRDAGAPSFRIIATGKDGRDSTLAFAPDMEDDYPFRDAEGAPFLPWVLYHAQDTGMIWDAYSWDELVSGTLATGLMFTLFAHAVKDASWVQKWGLNVQLAGMEATGEGSATRTRVSTDPASILLFNTSGDGAASLGSFPLPADPLKLIEAIRAYQIMVCEGLGIGKIDIQSAQSGTAIQIRRDQIRDLTVRAEPQFRKGDLELLRKAAQIFNLFGTGAKLPTDGYQIAYSGVPLSMEEQTTGLARDLALVAQGLMSKADVLMNMHPGMTRIEAAQRLDEIRRENRATE